MAFLEIGKILRAAAEAFKSDHKTMKEFDLWVAKSCAFGKVTASKYRRMSVLFHEKYPKILEEVRMPYLRELDFTIAYDVFSAWEAKEKGNSTGKKAKTAGKFAELKWSSDGIFVRYDGDEGFTDIQKLTTRKQKNKLKPVNSTGSSDTPEGNVEQEPVAKDSAEASSSVVDSQNQSGLGVANNSELLRNYNRLRDLHDKSAKEHKKREQELLQELDAARKRADQLAAELERLRAQPLAGKVA